MIPAEPEKNLDSVVMTMFRAITDTEGTTNVKIVFMPQDDTTKNFGRSPYFISLRDFDQQVTQSPRLEAAWDTVNDVMGLAYDFFRLREKVKEGQDRGDDVTALIAARNAALTALRAPLP